MSAVFITATGTEIGKTFVAAGLIRHWRKSGRPVDALKPVMTGYNATAGAASDAGVLLGALGRPMSEAEIDRISPWRFAVPLSPDMAAKREERSIDFDTLVDFTRQAARHPINTVLIEGIGGVMVPLDQTHTVLDWMTELNAPALLVTGSYLGSLSHTLTSRDAMRRRGVDLRAIVVNETAGSMVPLADTVATLQRFAGGAAVIALPRLPAGIAEHAAFAEIALAI
jgi:dethiobiotin synthetase